MVKPERVRRQQLMRQAEGYLELCLAGDEWGGATTAVRDRLVDRGLECLEELEPKPSIRAHLFRLRGQLLRVAERFDMAVDVLRQAVAAAPGDLSLYVSLGWCYKRLNRLDLAIEILEQATDFEDKTGIIHYNLACYWALAGHVTVSIRHLAQAFEIDAELRDLVANESDFDPIREHPDFQSLMTVIV
ncbi:MAG TPA: hypothetical protein DCQ98_20730 [Planctomycetaceae bacterium]|nr:hypothetical protein [Planctomycetaceae bacterium]HRE99038.1 tetratricopeptide repeat protein [Pirellulaceae bacterium]